MCRFNVTALICLVLAAFLVGSNAEENGLEALHQELALQLLEDEQAGVTGEDLAAKLRENRKALNEIEREEEGVLDEIHEELALQLMEEEQAGVSGEELAAKLREGRRVLNEMDREFVEHLLGGELASMTGEELARMLVQEESRQSKGAKCTVEGFTAKCCVGTSFKVFWKRHEFNACVELTFLPEEMGLHLKITARGSTVFEKKVAAGSANGICVKVPKLRSVSVCLKVSNLQAEGGHFSGCLAVEPKVFGKTIKTLNLGCISLP